MSMPQWESRPKVPIRARREPMRWLPVCAAMTSTNFNPLRAEQRLHWRNRWADWRERRAELWLHALLILLMLAFLLLMLAQRADSIDSSVAYVLKHGSLAATGLSFWLMHRWQMRMGVAQQALWARHWLRAQPMDACHQRRMLRRRILGLAALQAALGCVLLARQNDAGLKVTIWILLSAVAALLAAWRLDRVSHSVLSASARRRSIGPALGTGSFFYWQCNEAIACFTPSRSAPLVFLLLLVPAPIGGWRMLLVVATLMLSGWAAAAWRSSVAVLPAATKWLAAEALPGRKLMSACLGFPAALLSAVLLIVFVILMLIDAGDWGSVLVLSLLFPAALHYVCAAAERHRPMRIAFLFVFHLMIIFVVLQTLPPLLIPIGLLQLGWLWHKGIRA